MLFRKAAIALAVCASFLAAQAPKPAITSEARTAREMESLKFDPLRLRNFLKAMPKGGDLHNHLSGAVYAESYLQWAADEGDCIDTAALSIVKSTKPNQCAAGQVSAKSALTNPALYGSLLNAMSMYQYLPEKTHDTAHDHFFATFPRFGVVSQTHWGDMLAEVSQRAADQSEEYLELITGIDKDHAAEFAPEFTSDSSGLHLDAAYQQVLAKGIRSLVPQMKGWLDDAEARRRKIQDCEAHDHVVPGCNVEVRYIFEIYRGLPANRVFAQMIAGFELASADSRIVAINLVMPEDWYVPMHDYELHMRMLDFLHQKYPKVRITLHAGEFVPGLIPFEGLCCHIRQAIKVGHAERIGHGVDVTYENHPEQLLKEMADRRIPVEINLISNRVILGVSGKMHPLRQYLQAGVPVVISTDDEGVSRSTMTDELMAAVLDQSLTYQQIKQAEFNSIRYSFADDATKKKLTQCLTERFAAFEKNSSAPQPPCSSK